MNYDLEPGIESTPRDFNFVCEYILGNVIKPALVDGRLRPEDIQVVSDIRRFRVSRDSMTPCHRVGQIRSGPYRRCCDCCSPASAIGTR